MRSSIQTVFLIIGLMPLQAQTVGVVVSNGPLTVDRAAVTGNANLAGGSLVETRDAAARIQLGNGGRATLGPESAARIHDTHMVLEKGAGLLVTAAYSLRAGGFEVRGARAQVALHEGAVHVAAVDGLVEVTGAGGVPVARLRPGRVLSLSPTAGDTSAMSGVVRAQGGRFMLSDEVTGLDVELRGAGLDGLVGERVEVNGRASASADRLSQVIEVARVNRLVEQEQPPTGAAKPGAAPKGPPAERAKRSEGLSAGAKVGIIAAIGGGAAAGIFAASSGKDDGTPVSR